MKIISLKNEKIKEVVKLRHRKRRQESGLTVIEGVREVSRALDAKCLFKEFFVCKDFLDQNGIALAEKIRKLKKPVFDVTREVFEKISYGDRREGVLAVAEPKQKILKDLFRKKNPLYLVIEGVEKPGNLGAMLRSADGAGVDAVMICDAGTDIYNPNVIRASTGTIFALFVVTAAKEDVLDFFKTRGIKICATLPSAGKKYFEEDLSGGLAVVMGSEKEGLNDFWVQHADIGLRIPMRGKADSLNVSVSSAILLYEAIRQRQ